MPSQLSTAPTQSCPLRSQQDMAVGSLAHCPQAWEQCWWLPKSPVPGRHHRESPLCGWRIRE